MLLSLMRKVLTGKIQKAAKNNPEIGRKLNLRDFVMAIVTIDGKSGIHFIFKDGKVTSGKGDHPHADARLIWKSGTLAFRVLVSQNDFKMGKALMSRKLTSEGDVNMILHFKDIAAKAMA